MKTGAILLVLVMVLVVGTFLGYASGFVVVNPKAVPRVEVKAVESDFEWDAEQGHYVLTMPNTCGVSDESLYQQLVRRFPQQEAKVDKLTMNDVVFILPDDATKWHEVIFSHWKRFGTINVVFYNALVYKKQIVYYEDAEEIMRGDYT